MPRGLGMARDWGTARGMPMSKATDLARKMGMAQSMARGMGYV